MKQAQDKRRVRENSEEKKISQRMFLVQVCIMNVPLPFFYTNLLSSCVFFLLVFIRFCSVEFALFRSQLLVTLLNLR